jgi:hypothetical protein
MEKNRISHGGTECTEKINLRDFSASVATFLLSEAYRKFFLQLLPQPVIYFR